MAEQTSTEKKPATKAQARPTAVERERDETRDDDRPERIDVEREWDERVHGPSPSEKAEQGGDF